MFLLIPGSNRSVQATTTRTAQASTNQALAMVQWKWEARAHLPTRQRTSQETASTERVTCRCQHCQSQPSLKATRAAYHSISRLLLAHRQHRHRCLRTRDRLVVGPCMILRPRMTRSWSSRRDRLFGWFHVWTRIGWRASAIIERAASLPAMSRSPFHCQINWFLSSSVDSMGTKLFLLFFVYCKLSKLRRLELELFIFKFFCQRPFFSCFHRIRSIMPLSSSLLFTLQIWYDRLHFYTTGSIILFFTIKCNFL